MTSKAHDKETISATAAANGANRQPVALAAEAADPSDPAPKSVTPREGTKQARLIAMLRAETGATIGEIMAATGWQSHTVRGAMTGALKKRLGLTINSAKVADRGRVYRLVG